MVLRSLKAGSQTGNWVVLEGKEKFHTENLITFQNLKLLSKTTFPSDIGPYNTLDVSIKTEI